MATRATSFLIGSSSFLQGNNYKDMLKSLDEFKHKPDPPND